MSTVKIVFDPRKVARPADTESTSVCALFNPESSYVDGAAYDGSRFDSNVPGLGIMDAPEPYASTSVPMSTPLAQFKMATQATADTHTGVRTLSFEVDDYKEAFYYKQLGEDMKDQGFTVTVTETAKASEGASSGSPGK